MVRSNDFAIFSLTKNFILTIWFVCFALVDECEMISKTYFGLIYIPFYLNTVQNVIWNILGQQV